MQTLGLWKQTEKPHEQLLVRFLTRIQAILSLHDLGYSLSRSSG